MRKKEEDEGEAESFGVELLLMCGDMVYITRALWYNQEEGEECDTEAEGFGVDSLLMREDV
jgi:hypothetical protein